MLWQMYSSPPSDLQCQQRLICVWSQHFLPVPWLQSWHEATEAQSVGRATSTSTCSVLTQLVSHASPCSDTSCSESVTVLQSYRLWASSGSTLEAPVVTCLWPQADFQFGCREDILCHHLKFLLLVDPPSPFSPWRSWTVLSKFPIQLLILNFPFNWPKTYSTSLLCQASSWAPVSRCNGKAG